MFRQLKSLRWLVVTISMAAWFVASNHCVLAARPTVTSVGKASTGCPMHAQKQQTPTPSKGKGCGDLPCCKNLQATATTAAKTVAKPMWLGLLQPFFALSLTIVDADTPSILQILDNGPPGNKSFAELVLQRSILAHAPPSVA